MEHHDRIGVALGDRLDLDTTLGAQHQQVLLGPTIERERGVVLLLDVAGVLDPDPLDDMALDVHAEDVAGVQAHLIGVVGELDPARLAAPTDLHLGLDHHRVPGRLGGGHRLVDRQGDVARTDRDVEAGEVLLALVFEEIHVGLTLFRVEFVFEPGADGAQRRSRLEDLGDALLLERPGVGVGDDASTEHEHIVEIGAP